MSQNTTVQKVHRWGKDKLHWDAFQMPSVPYLNYCDDNTEHNIKQQLSSSKKSLSKVKYIKIRVA